MLKTPIKLVKGGLTIVAGLNLFSTSYITTLALLALPEWKPRRLVYSPEYQFTIIIPAHNEELLIGKTLASLQELDYPEVLLRICVVADNCSDETASIARAMGVEVFERTDSVKRGKGYALEWVLEKLEKDDKDEIYTAYVFLDADSTLESNFLRVAARELAGGAKVVQAYYAGANPDDSWRSALRYVALAAINYARPLGRERLGLSVGLKGNGMVFEGELIRKMGWRVYTRAEDVEMHARLLLDGKRVGFAPDTAVYGMMPSTGKQARSQEMRWEGGRLEMARTFVPRFLGAMAGRSRKEQLILLDSAVEVTIPPISILAGLGVVGWVIGWLFKAKGLQRLSALSLIELVIYIFSSLVASKAPPKVYLALPFAPLFIVWKIGLYAYTILSHKGNQEWIRTSRQS